MHFYQSATRYQEAYFNHDIERYTECTLIYNRYLQRNSENKIYLPEPIRLQIVHTLLRGNQNIFSIK